MKKSQSAVLGSESLAKQVKKIIQVYNIRPVRERGQNFLIDPSVITKMIDVSGVTNDDIVLEVGPGLGILTEILIKRAQKVVSIELDERLLNFLKLKFGSTQNLQLVHGDILKWKPENVGLRALEYKIIANLPYQVTSHFLRQYLTTVNRPSSMTLLLQKEVVERICAKPGAMSMLSIAVQLYGTPTMVSIVKRDKFWPVPDVDSAVVHIAQIKNTQVVDNFLDGTSDKFFWRIVKIGFSARRKTLKNNLMSGLRLPSNDIEKLLNSAKLRTDIRAQNLSVQDWAILAKLVENYHS